MSLILQESPSRPDTDFYLAINSYWSRNSVNIKFLMPVFYWEYTDGIFCYNENYHIVKSPHHRTCMNVSYGHKVNVCVCVCDTRSYWWCRCVQMRTYWWRDCLPESLRTAFQRRGLSLTVDRPRPWVGLSGSRRRPQGSALPQHQEHRCPRPPHCNQHSTITL